MIVPDNRDEILKHLQGKWTRTIQGNENVSFTIEGQHVKDIRGIEGIEETDFVLEFNGVNLKWQLTSPVFGIGPSLVNFEKKSFTILLRNGTDILPQVNISEVYHQNVWFNKV